MQELTANLRHCGRNADETKHAYDTAVSYLYVDCSVKTADYCSAHDVSISYLCKVCMQFHELRSRSNNKLGPRMNKQKQKWGLGWFKQ